MQQMRNLTKGSINLFFKTLTLTWVHLYKQYYNTRSYFSQDLIRF